jgi:hypothetical protein
MEFTGTGAQVYVCSATGGNFAWTLKAPDATLTDANKKVVGKRFAGPTWQAADGSSVVGEVVANSPAPRPGAIPWLVLHAKSHDGSPSAQSRAFDAPCSGWLGRRVDTIPLRFHRLFSDFLLLQ